MQAGRLVHFCNYSSLKRIQGPSWFDRSRAHGRYGIWPQHQAARQRLRRYNSSQRRRRGEALAATHPHHSTLSHRNIS